MFFILTHSCVYFIFALNLYSEILILDERTLAYTIPRIFEN